jgi:hypothetical protein
MKVPCPTPAAKAQSTTQVVTCEPFSIGADLAVLLTTLAGKTGCTAFYRVNRITCCPDLAFRLAKLAFETGSDAEADHYDVNLSASTCECKGFLRWNKPCKHLTALRQLFERGCLQ